MPTASELLAQRRAQKLQPVTVEAERRQPVVEQKSRIRPAPGSPLTLAMLSSENASPRTTEETRATPEIGSAPVSPMQGARLALGLASTLGDKGQAEVIKNIIPEAAIREDDKGNTFVGIDGQEYLLNRPGMSEQDLLQGMAQILSFVPAGRLANGMSTLLGKMATGFAGGAGTSMALDAISASQGAKVDPVDAGVRAVVSGGTEALVPGVGALAGGARRLVRGESRLPVDALPETRQAVEESQRASEATGVDLFPAQRTVVPSQLGKQRAVAELPGGAQTAFKALTKQNEQAAEATARYLDSVAPPSSVETGPTKFRSAAQKAVEAVKRARKEAASPIYNQAWKEGAQVDVAPVNEAVKEALEFYPKGGEIRRSIGKIKTMLGSAGSDIRKLHNVKTEIDQMMEAKGERGLGPTTRFELEQIQSRLLEQMDAASDLYKSARAEFEAASPAVEELTEGLIGRAAKMDDTQLRRLASTIFNPQETNTTVVRRVRAVIDTVDPDAYDQLLRSELERRLGSVRTTQAPVQNVPGQIFRALFGNDKQSKVLYAALRQEQQGNAKFLETALQRASLGRPGGSDTASKQVFRDEIKGVGNVLRRFLSDPITGIPKTLADIGEDAALQRKAMAVARIMYDPSYVKDVRAIRQISEPTEAGKRMQSLLQASLVAELRESSPTVQLPQTPQSRR